jgi:imidazoleglycerol-phosphate dehydratase
MGFRDDLEFEVCAQSGEVRDVGGLTIKPTHSGGDLAKYDMVILPGGNAARHLVQDEVFLAWLQTMNPESCKVSVCTGALLLGAAGFLSGKQATTHPSSFQELQPYCLKVIPQRVVEDGEVITAGGVTASIDLGLYLVEKLAGEQAKRQIQRQMDYTGQAVTVQPDHGNHAPGDPAGGSRSRLNRSASLDRKTNETSIHLSLNVDGSGRHSIETGIGFLDHMLSHLAVHGLFDLSIHATGDLHVDVHHTVEDTALVLGQAFAQAMGDRAGIQRMASAYAPMDETLAFVSIDFSGRPYACVEASWHSPEAGGIPTSLFPHFLESFAMTARCNLHARILYGNDDHHQAEALFKALARALDGATQIDPRRAGFIPSTKGSLTG